MFAEAKRIKQFPGAAQERLGCRAAIHVDAVRAPSGDNLVRPYRPFGDHRVIAWADGVLGFAHFMGVCVAPRKDISDLERAKTQSTSAPFAAFNSWVVLHFGRFGGIEHDKKNALCVTVPCAGQGVTIPFAIRIDRSGWRVVFDVCAGDHGMEAITPEDELKATLNDKNPTWLHLSAAIGADGDGLAFEGRPNFFAVLDATGDH